MTCGGLTHRPSRDDNPSTLARFRLQAVASLARQIGFAPAARRRRQLAEAETLCGEIDSQRAYPTEFVVFRITGYHAKTIDGDGLLTGVALRHDLGLLVETVSDPLNLRADDAGEPVLGVEEVAARFDVSTKTIQRWRRKGLCARRMIFGDGKKRVAFLLSAVERFAGGEGGEVAANATAVGGGETAAMARHARRLAAGCGCDEAEVCRRIAKRFGRSPMAVLHTLRHHDRTRPGEAVLPLAGPPVPARIRRRIIRRARRGRPIRVTARKLGLRRSAVARVVVNHEARRLAKRRAKYIDDPLLHGPDAAAHIADLLRGGELSGPAKSAPRPAGPETELSAMCRAPLLTPARERALFLKFNYHRRQFTLLRRDFEPMLARRRDLQALRAAADAATETKNQIVRANMRLVASVARKHLRPGLDLMELVSDGAVVLMRAVDGFDVSKGNKFSTYATLALMKGYARSVPQLQARASAGTDPARLAEVADRGEPVAGALARREAVGRLLAELDAQELEVVLAHHGMAREHGKLVDGPPATLDQVGRRLGLTRHRVREIEHRALAKLRTAGGSLGLSPSTT